MMRFVVDSNVLFTFFWKGSVFKKICTEQDCMLFTPEFALEGINKHHVQLLKKTGISRSEFKELLKELAARVEFMPLANYGPAIKKVKKLSGYFRSEDRSEFLEDLDFFALALHLGLPIWSNDKLLKKQPEVIALSTKEIIELVDAQPIE
ncbi:MAG: hypothetical protein J4432_05500 [DPANN group archaeon]|nr:hypothetical protein [DPANN group archaeon]